MFLYTIFIVTLILLTLRLYTVGLVKELIKMEKRLDKKIHTHITNLQKDNPNTVKE